MMPTVPILVQSDDGAWQRIDLLASRVKAWLRLHVDCDCWRHAGRAHVLDAIVIGGVGLLVRPADSDPAIPFAPSARAGAVLIRGEAASPP